MSEMHRLMGEHVLKRKWADRGSGPYNIAVKATRGHDLCGRSKAVLETLFYNNAEREWPRRALGQIDMGEMW